MTTRYCSRCLQMQRGDPASCVRPACRAPRPTDGWPTLLEPGEVLDGRFEIGDAIGGGGAAIAYRALDREAGDEVVVKVLHRDRQGGVLRQRLAIEAELLESLRHPCIVPFRDASLPAQGPCWLATELMEGGTLSRFLARGPLPAATVEAIGRQLALALDAVHAQGVVHRDVKPENILIESSEPEVRVRLADFGIARLQRHLGGGGLTMMGAFIGTPAYAAPEQGRADATVGPPADCFALGLVLHHAGAGQPLRDRGDPRLLEQLRASGFAAAARPRLVDLRPGDPDIDTLARLDGVIDALLEPAPSQRLDAAYAALRLGAAPSALAGHAAVVALPTLQGATEDDLAELEALAGDWDALVPPDEIDGRSVTLGPPTSVPSPRHVAPPPTPGGASGPAARRGPDPALARLAIAPGALTPDGSPPPIAPRRERPGWGERRGWGPITRDTAAEWEDTDLGWPSREVVRARRLSLALVLAAALAAVAIGSPDGLAALLPAAWRADHPALVERLRAVALPPPRSEAATPPKGTLVPSR